MSIISSALEDEREIDRAKKDKRDDAIRRSQEATAQSQTLGNGPQKGHRYMTPNG